MLELSLNQVRHSTLARQGLLQRLASDDPAQFGVLHSTDYATPYLSLLGRLEKVAWPQLNAAGLRKIRCMRGTLHLIPPEYWPAIQALYIDPEDDLPYDFKFYKIPLDEARELRFYILEALQLHGGQTVNSLKKLLPAGLQKTYQSDYRGAKISGAAPVLRWMWSTGYVEVPLHPSNWRSQELRYELPPQPTPPRDAEGRARAAQQILRWYLSLYAPVAYEDWAWWTGLKAEINRPAFEALMPDMLPVQVEGISEKLWILAEQESALRQAPAEIPPMTRLLPYEDALLKAYKDTRYRFYDDEGLAETVAFSKGGEALPTLWQNGQIMGVWEWQKKPDQPMTLSPFLQFTTEGRKAFKEEVERMRATLEAGKILWTA
jgi:hypothetical protein